jgi:hypothetical protein
MIEGYAGFGSDILATKFSSSAVVATTSEQLTHAWAESFSATTVASAAGIMRSIPIKHDTPAISAVLKAPFLILWAAILLYIVFALGLAFAAVRNVLARPGVREVQARMSIMGIASQALEPNKYAGAAKSTNDLFHTTKKSDDYSNRVTISRTPVGGWSWETMSTQQRRGV